MRLLPAVLLLSLSGCGYLLAQIRGDQDPKLVAAAKYLECAPGRISFEERDTDVEMQWLATGCGKEVACRDSETGWRCFQSPPQFRDFGTGWRERPPLAFAVIALAIEKLTGCAADDTRITTQVRNASYVATNCGRDFRCGAVLDSVRREMTVVDANCQETAASTERTAEQITSDRLSLETGCNAVKLTGKTAWTRGTERAFRFDACGKVYVCTTAASRTDCKVALDSARVHEPQREEPRRDPSVAAEPTPPPPPPAAVQAQPARQPLKSGQ